MRIVRLRVPHARRNTRFRLKRYTPPMGRFAIAAALALILSAPLHAGVEITSSGNRWDVTAAGAPVSEVLDGLARKTRMKVIYEGGIPRTPVTVELRGRTPAEAVLGVLEGLGLNYALVLDVSGTEVETLMIVGTGGVNTPGSSGSSPRVFGASRRGRRDPPRDIAEEPMVESEEPAEFEASPPVAHDVPRLEEPAKPAPAMIGPLNPTGAFAGAAPPVPGPPLVIASPSPNPPPSH